MNGEFFVGHTLKKARKAATRKAFSEAKVLFAEVLQRPEMEMDIDIWLRHAYCAEQSEDLVDAVKSYRKALSIYHDLGEDSAADMLKAKIDNLEQANLDAKDSKKKEIAGKVRRIQSNAMPMPRDALIRRLFQLGIPRHLNPDEVLCEENKLPSHLWLLLSGSLMVQVDGYVDEELMTPKPGGLMLVGEGGFFTNQPRGATVIARDEAEVIEIGSDVTAIERNADPAFAAAMDLLLLDYWIDPVLSRHEIFAKINDVDRYRLAREFELVEIDAGQTLIEAGTEHNAAYLLLSGRAFLVHADPGRESDMVERVDDACFTKLVPADVINLGGLLRGNISPYQVVATTPLQLLRLSLERFEPFTLRRSWIVNAIMKISQKPAYLQVIKPDESYRWFIDRHVNVGI